MTTRRFVFGCFAWLVMIGCSSATQQPASVDTKNDACAHCRMMVSDARFAAQIVAKGEEPRFFDDIGCLRDHLQRSGRRDDAVMYVADHRTKAWVLADKAVYVRNDQVRTPMGSHILAFADAASRDADPAGRATPLTYDEVFDTRGKT